MKLHTGSSGMEILSPQDIENIYAAALRLLDQGGAIVENQAMLDRFAQAGARVDLARQRVFFPESMIEEHIRQSRKIDWASREVSFSATAELYEGPYMDPEDGRMKDWTLDRLQSTVKVARTLKNLSGVSTLGCPMKDTPVQLQPLYEKLICWKYGVMGGHAIWDTALCPKIEAMFTLYAESKGKKVGDFFTGIVFLISPLKLGHVEAAQFMYFQERGLRVRIGYNGALGGGLPVTPAGGLVVQLAEALFISILNRIFFADDTLNLGAAISVLDMSTAAQQYGRPEKSMTNLAMAQIARWLHVPAGGHCGLSDAKEPGYEAGVQKATSAIFSAMACGHGYIAAGLLGTDEIFSPIQMILDHDFLGSLRWMCRGIDTSPEQIGLETLLEEGPGAALIGTEHTALHFRESLWQPATWSNAMLGTWARHGRKHDVDRARDYFLSIVHNGKPFEYCLDEDTENRLMQIIDS